MLAIQTWKKWMSNTIPCYFAPFNLVLLNSHMCYCFALWFRNFRSSGYNDFVENTSPKVHCYLPWFVSALESVWHLSWRWLLQRIICDAIDPLILDATLDELPRTEMKLYLFLFSVVWISYGWNNQSNYIGADQGVANSLGLLKESDPLS